MSPTAPRQHGGHPLEGHEAGDDCAAWLVGAGISLSAEPQAAAGTSGLGAAEIQDVHLCEWVFLAWTPYQFTI